MVDSVAGMGMSGTGLLAFSDDEQLLEMLSHAVPGSKQGVDLFNGGVQAASATVDSGIAPEVLVIDISNTDDPLPLTAHIAKTLRGRTAVLAVGERNDIGLYRTLVGLGVTDYLLRSELTVQQLRRAVLTAGRQDSEPVETPKAALGKVIVFIGVRGGEGETALCTSVAWRLANTHNQQVALVDMDMQFGTTALSLDLDPGTGFRDALENYERIDSLLVASAMVPLGANLNVLCAEESPARGNPPSQEATQRLMNVLRPDVEALIIDLPRYLLPSAKPMLEAAEHVVLVTDLSLSALRDAARVRQALADEGLGDAVRFVANRIGLADDGKLTVQEFQNSLKAKFDAVIPEDPKAAKAALEGKPLGAGGAKPKTTEEIARLTRKLGGIAEPAKGGSKWIPKLKVPRRG